MIIVTFVHIHVCTHVKKCFKIVIINIIVTIYYIIVNIIKNDYNTANNLEKRKFDIFFI